MGLYRLGQQGYLRLLLSVEPDGDVLGAVRTLRYLVRRDAKAIDRYVESRDALEQQRQVLVAQREEAERWAAEERSRRDRLVAVRRRQQRLLEEASRERRELARRADELEAKERRLARLISALAAASDALDGEPIQEFQGVLDWPVEGEVTTGFGPRLDPRYGTRVPHTGIEIASEPGREAAAVYPGKVLFAAPLEGYGPTVVMLHPGRVFTLYAGLTDLRVSSEDVLSLGSMVGTTSERLYFEIRVENRPQDPLRWLR